MPRSDRMYVREYDDYSVYSRHNVSITVPNEFKDEIWTRFLIREHVSPTLTSTTWARFKALARRRKYEANET